jgi:hypothetical protein
MVVEYVIRLTYRITYTNAGAAYATSAGLGTISLS